MYVLDTDTSTLFFNGSENVVRRVLATPNQDIYIPAIVVEEQLKGRMAALARLSPVRDLDRVRVPYT